MNEDRRNMGTESESELDGRIRAALKLSVPEDIAVEKPWKLDQKVAHIESARTRREPAPSPPWMRPMAIAASFVAAVTLAAALWPAPGNSPLAEEVLAHLAHEPEAMVISDQAAPEAVVAGILDPRAEVDLQVLGLVTYAMDCGFEGENVPHLVIQGEKGPVMLLFLKNKRLDRIVSVRGNGYRGIVMPLGEGSIAIVGTDAEPVNRIRDRMGKTVRWRI